MSHRTRGGRDPTAATIAELASKLQLARGERPDWDGVGQPGAVFLVGAGCSASARIPLAGAIARDVACRAARTLAGEAAPDDPEAALRLLLDGGHLRHASAAISDPVDWEALYAPLFEEVCENPLIQRGVIRDAIGKGDGAINWAHICLGQLVARRYVHTVLTTNFDQLVLRGVLLAGQVPVVVDGVEMLRQVDAAPAFPQVVHLHGSMHTYAPRNGTAAVRQTADEPSVGGMFWQLLRENQPLIVVGYAGREEGILQELVRTVSKLQETRIYWVAYERRREDLPPQVLQLMTGRGREILLGQDADAFFAELMKAMAKRVDWMEHPLSPLFGLSGRITHSGIEEVDYAVQEHERLLRILEDKAGGLRAETGIADAAANSLSGQDEQVIAALEARAGGSDRRAERLLASSLRRAGELADKPDLLRRSLKALEKAREQGDDSAALLIRLGETCQALAGLEEDAHGDHAEIERLRETARQAFETARQASPALSRDWRLASERFAIAVTEIGDAGADEAAVGRAVQVVRDLIAQRRSAPGDLGTDDLHNLLSSLLLMQGDRNRSADMFRAAADAAEQAIALSSSEPSSTRTASMRRNLAAALRGLGSIEQEEGPGDGVVHLRRAAETYEAAALEYLAGPEDADRPEAVRAAFYALQEASELAVEVGPAELARRIETHLKSLDLSR